MPILKGLPGRPGAVAVCLAALLAWASPSTANASPDRGHRVKAVFLFDFAQFVQWPDSVDGRKVAAAVKAASPATPVILPTGWGQSPYRR